MKPLLLLNRPYIQRLFCSITYVIVGLFSHSVMAQPGSVYSTPGLYTYTVPAGGPYQIRLTARGGDGGGLAPTNGGSGATVASTFTVQSGNVLTIIVGQNGFYDVRTEGCGNCYIGSGGGGGGSAVVVNRNGTRTVLVAAGGGGGGGGGGGTNYYPGGGGQGTGLASSGVGGANGLVSSSGGGGGGLQGPGGNGGTGGRGAGGTGGGAATLTAVSAGGTYVPYYVQSSVNGGSGFGGGGAAGGFDTRFPAPAGGGGGGYGGGQGAKSGPQSYENQADGNNPIYTATGGFSNISTSGTNRTITPGTKGGSQNEAGMVTLSFPNNIATAAFTTPSQTLCPGSPATLQGTVSATGSWTLTLSDGTVSTGNGSTFSVSVSPVTSTTYTIQSLTDQLGSVNNLTSRAIVTTNPAPTVSLTNNGPLSCGQTSVTLTATGNASSYTFTSGNTILPGSSTSSTRVVSSTGEFTVRATGANSCTNSATTTVTRSDANPITVSLSNNGPFTCSKTSVTLTATSNATSYTFTSQGNILPGDPASNTRIISAPGDYVVRVSGAGSCTNSTFTTVERRQQNPPDVQLYHNDGPLTCAKTEVMIFVAPRSGFTPIVSYTFTYGNTVVEGDPTSPFRTVSQPGQYLARVTDANGCTGVTGIVVEQASLEPPSVSLNNNGPLTCTRNSVRILATSSGFTYRFYYNGVLIDGQTNSSFRNVSEPGVYTVQVTGGNLCTATASTTVIYSDESSLPVTLTSNGPFTCAQTSVTLTASGGTSYTFTRQGTVLPGDPVSNTRVISEPGDYVVRVANDTGCTGSTSTNVSRPLQDTPAVTMINNGPLSCERPTVTLTAYSTNSIQISSFTFTYGDTVLDGNPASLTRTVSQPGQYLVRVTGTNGCTNVTGTFVEQASQSPPSVELTTTGDLTCTQTSVRLRATSEASVYRFYRDGVLLDDETSRTFRTVSEPGVYTVQVTDGNLCTGTASVTVTQTQGLTISLTNNGPLTCAQPSVTLTATGGDTYAFSGPGVVSQTGNIALVNTPGTYSVTVTNTETGCSSTTTTTVNSTSILITVTNPGQTTAIVGELFSQPFTATGGNSPYSFSITSGNLPPGLSLSGEGVLSGTPTQSGSFSLSVQARDTGGCMGVSNSVYTLQVRDVTPTLTLASISVNPALVCAGSVVTFNGTVANATGSYAYTLTNGNSTTTGSSNSPAFSQPWLAAGSGVQTFTLTVSSAGQSAMATTTLTVNSLPTPTISASNSGLLTCGQTSLTLTASGGDSYRFSGPGVLSQTGNTALVNASGTYSVTVTNTETGCFSTTNTAISGSTDSPTVSISASGTALTCTSPSISLTATGGATYRWEDNSTAAVRAVNAAGAYSVTATTSSSCSASTTRTITSTTALLTVTNPGQTTAIVGELFSQTFTAFGGTGPYNFSIPSGNLPPGLSLSGEGVLSGTPTQSGSFVLSVQARDTGGCTAISGTAYTLLIRDVAPTLTVTNVLVNPALVCVGNSVTVTATVSNATGSYAYTLTNGNSITTGTGNNSAFGQTLIASGSGMQTFTLTVSSAGQSATTTTTLTVNPPPSPMLVASNGGLLTCGQTSLTLTAGGGDNYRFSGPGVVSQSGNTAIVNTSGIYSVTATSASGCFSTTSITIDREVDVPTATILTPTSATLSCTTPSISLTAIGGGTYRWDNNSNDPIRTVTTSGIYSVTVTAANGCTARRVRGWKAIGQL